MGIKSLLLAGIILCMVGCKADSSSTETFSPSFTGSIIPLYSYPTDEAWTSLSKVNTTLETIAIINPNNGPVECNTTMSDTYREGINQLKTHSIKVIGYVYTKYSARPVEVVEADITRYKECYPNLDGVFLDETNESAESALYYKRLYSFVKEDNASQKVVLNPGRYPDEEIVQASDITIIYENGGERYDAITPPEYISKYPSSKFALLGYRVPQTAVTAQKLEKLNTFRVGYVYLTNDGIGEDNPWDTLSSYYDSLMEMLLSH
ncbi:MAG: spherulation-specific family 4 protein [Campylobacterales bacterium]|nr:spherulation-specific family 4 protein [Campylobacterales bacterium]